MSSRRPTKCRTHKIGKINIIKITGRLTPDENDDILFSTVKQLADAGEKDFLLDLSAINYINSTGIGSIIQAYRVVQGKGGNVKLLNPSQCVTHIMQVSKLDSIFEIFHDQEVAIASYVEDPAPPNGGKKGRTRKQADDKEDSESE